MYNANTIERILRENATSFIERNQLNSLTEAEMHAVNNAMVTNLYKSAIDKAHIDFDTIPDSRGDITKYTGYAAMKESISIIRQISERAHIKVSELDVVEGAINNIIVYRDSFQKGFQMQKEFIITQYNTLVYACVEAVSAIISSYVDFIKRPDRVEFTLIKGKDRHGSLIIDTLASFNAASKKGDVAKVLNAVISSGVEGFTGGAAATAGLSLLVVGAAMSIVPLIRELIFFGYYSRMKLSDYLEQQAALIEIHQRSLEKGETPAKKQEIARKQAQTAERLRRLSDKIKVNRVTAEREAEVSLRKENKTWTLSNVQAQNASVDIVRFPLL